MNFKDTMDLDVSLKYDAVNQGQIDVVEVYTTDGRLEDTELVILEDDKHFFPSYYAGTVITNEELAAHPELAKALDALTGKITTEDMIHMNYLVDMKGEEPSEVAHDFLVSKGIIGG